MAWQHVTTVAATLRPSQHTAHVARVLGHPLRLRILHEYHRDATSPSRIARRLDLPISVVAYHTNALKRLGCIEQIRTERRRGVIERFHHAVAAPPIGERDWEHVPLNVRRRLTRATLSLLMGDAARAADQGGFDRAQSHVSRRPLQLDAEGLDALGSLLRRLDGEITALEAASAARGGALVSRELAVLAFEDASTPA
jgi:DNA-binding transcriptional ArsR family regulator